MTAIGWRMAKERGFDLTPWSSEKVRAPASDGASSAKEVPPTLPDREALIPHLRSEFQIREESGVSRVAILADVSPVQVMRGHLGTFASYSVLFEGPPGLLKDSANCLLEHPQLGRMEFFLTAVGKPGAKSFLEAVFSQRIT